MVEALLRPTITNYTARALDPKRDMNRRIYSSHFHTTIDDRQQWRRRWADFKATNPEVDTDDDGHSRRADLFDFDGNRGAGVHRVQVFTCKPNARCRGLRPTNAPTSF